jgi:DNA-binding transcriptional ArsR family regulator
VNLYPDTPRARALCGALGDYIQCPEAAESMFEALWKQARGDLTLFLAKAETCLRGNGIDPAAVPDAPELEASEPPAAPAEPEATTAPVEPVGVVGGTRPRWHDVSQAAVWRRRTRGKVNQDVRGDYTNMVPKYVDATVRAAMPNTVLLAYLACTDEADLDGQFEMPAGRLAALLGVSRRHAQRALAVVREAKLVKVVHPGGQRVASIYSLTPWREFDKQHTLRALERNRQRHLADIEKRLGECTAEED